MDDMIINHTGNSRLLKSSIPADITHEQLVTLLRDGTFPVDFNGYNSAGIKTLGTPLNKNTLLRDETAAAFGFTDKTAATVNNALLAAIMNTYAANNRFMRTAVSEPESFNALCGAVGVPIGATWADTCKDDIAKTAIMENGALMHIMWPFPELTGPFGALTPSLAAIKNSVKHGWYDLWPLGSSVAISIDAFHMASSMPAKRALFSLIAIDTDINKNSEVLPLTFFTTSYISETFSMRPIAVTSLNIIYDAFESAWRDIVEPETRRKLKQSIGYVSCFLFNVRNIYKDTYSLGGMSGYIDLAAKQYPLYTQGKRSKYMNNIYWLADTTNSAGTSNASVQATFSTGSNGIEQPGSAAQTNTYGLVFGFCVKPHIT